MLRSAVRVLTAALVIAASVPAFAQSAPGPSAPEGDAIAQPAPAPSAPAERRLSVTGYAQAQSDLISRNGRSSDRVYFRRIMLTLDSALVRNWAGRVQFDLAPATEGDRIVLKDAYVRYTSLAGRGLLVTAGNQKTPFSRSLLTPSSRRGLVERPVTGDRNFGSPGRTLGVRADGRAGAGRWEWSASLGSALHSPDAGAIRFDSVTESDHGWNRGVLAAGRIEWQPLGAMARDQGDFGGPRRLSVGGGLYVWKNDRGRNLHTSHGRSLAPDLADVRSAAGLEVSGGWRGSRLSLDAEYHRVRARALDPVFTGGLFSTGTATLHEASFEGGVMVIKRRLETLAGLDTLAVDGRQAVIVRPALGADWYFAGHNVKIGVMHRDTVNDRGLRGLHARATYAAAQLAF